MERRRLCLFLVLTAMSLGAAPSERPHVSTQLEADFVMTRTLKVLADKITSSGRFILGGQGQLRWETNKPGSSVLVINGNRVWMHYPKLGVTKTFDVANDPVMSVLSSHLIALTSGELDEMKKLYTVTEISASLLSLVPRESEVQRLFKEMRVHLASKKIVDKVEMISKNGDITEILFKNIQEKKDINQKLFENL